jgi:hypothetical protein
MSRYRVIYRGGSYIDTAEPPAVTEGVWAIVDLDIIEGGDAYQELLRTIEASPSTQ